MLFKEPQIIVLVEHGISGNCMCFSLTGQPARLPQVTVWPVHINRRFLRSHAVTYRVAVSEVGQGRNSDQLRETKSAGLKKGHQVNTKRLFSIDEAATYIGISRVSIYRAANRGDIPLVKLGGRTLIEVSDLDAFIANHKTTAAA